MLLVVGSTILHLRLATNLHIDSLLLYLLTYRSINSTSDDTLRQSDHHCPAATKHTRSLLKSTGACQVNSSYSKTDWIPNFFKNIPVTTSFYTFIIIFIIIYFIQFNPTISSIPFPQIVHIVTFPHANIISNVKHVHLFYIIIVYTPQLLFLNPGFILKTPLPLMLLLYLIHLTSYSHVPHA